jgi:iron complex transport system substrate-binding protein
MRCAAALFALALAAMPPAFAAEPPQRVVSINLCTDELALLLAKPGQLVSVSALSHDPVESAYWREARSFPANRGSAEEIVPLKSDVVLAGTFTTRTTVSLLKQLGRRVVEVAPAATLGESRAAIRQMGEVLGNESRAEELIAEMDARIAAAAARIQAFGAPRKAVLYRPGEGIAGEASMQGTLMTALGIGNLAAVYGVHERADMPLEDFVQMKPDLIISAVSAYGRSVQSEAAAHPAFAHARAPRVTYPDVLTRCGSPVLAEAAERIADGVTALRFSQSSQ